MEVVKRNYYKIVFVVGVLLSVLWIIVVNTKPYSDFQYYNEVAKQIANGGSWGNTYTSVGYSIVLGFVYKIFGASIMVAKIFNVILTISSYIIIFYILKRVEIKERTRKLIFTIFVFLPNNIFYNSIIGSEIIFTTILLLITLIYFSNLKYKYTLIGIFTGVNAMIKPFFMVFFLAIFLLELIQREKLIKVIKHTLAILIVSILVISPWVYRNTKLIGEYTSISNNGGIVLYINNNSQNDTGRWMPAANVKDSIVNKKEYIKANMTEKNKMLSNAAKKWIIGHPIRFIQLGFKRVLNTFYSGDDIVYSFNGAGLSKNTESSLMSITLIIRMLIFIPATVMILIYSVKIIISLFNRKLLNSYIVYSVICFYMIACTYFITEGQGRYSFPIIFVMIYFFSVAVDKVGIKIHHLLIDK